MKKSHLLIILLFVALIPAIWYVPGSILGKGDFYPFIFQTENLNSDLSTWSSSNLGNPSPSPSYAVLGLLLNALGSAGIETGFLQIAFLMVCFGVAMFSMYFFTKTTYPESAVAGVIAGLFYVFNFFLFSIMFNIGMVWTYAWLPLLMALLTKALAQKTSTARNSLAFAFTFSVVASFASINLANVILLLIGLGAVYIYHLVFNRKIIVKQLIKVTAVLLILTSLLSIWWIIPNVNYYLPSDSSQLQADINVNSWSWSHQRASPLNLLSLNAGWGWRAEYTPYYQTYDNIVMSVLMIFPFVFACSALLFKQRRKTSLYLLLVILLFMFLAKGLHEPLSSVNLFLYNSIPYMSMFREPVSKFTLIAMPFLALLIGYAVSKIVFFTPKKIIKTQFRSVLSFCLVLFLLSPIFPIVANPLETKTQQLPFSSYVHVPQYWHEANALISSQSGDFRVLLTPPNDYYQMPYVWGYYGTDSLIEKLIEKPVVSTAYAYSYKTNPNMLSLINHLNDIIINNKTGEFESFLSIQNIKYIVQRNDLNYTYLASVGRQVISTQTMKAFLSNQSCLTLAATFGALDIYACNMKSAPIQILPLEVSTGYSHEIVQRNTSSYLWNFGSSEHLVAWQKVTLERQFDSACSLSLDNGTLKFEIANSTWGWKVLNSPLIERNKEASYNFSFKSKGQNAFEPHVKILEFNSMMEQVSTEQFSLPIDKTVKWVDFKSGDFIPQENTSFMQLQIWSGHASTTQLPNSIWVDDFKVDYSIEKINPKIKSILGSNFDNETVKILNYDRVSATKLSAKVNASTPFTLLMSEAYDKNWKAKLNNAVVSPISLFSLNAFEINKTGESTIIIEYEPQSWFLDGVIVSVVTFFVCLFFFLSSESFKNRGSLIGNFKIYSQKNLHFYDDSSSDLLRKGLQQVNNTIPKPAILDLGCGDGRLIYGLNKKELFKDGSKITAVDLSEDRIKRLKDSLSFVQAIKSDAVNVQLPSGSFDLVICSQLIEHLDSDTRLLQEIKRLLKPNGVLFISSVLKKKYAVYIYYKKGRFLLDPTHVKEYKSAKVFEDILKKANFKILKSEVNQLKYPLFDLFMRLLIKCGLSLESGFYEKHKTLFLLRKLCVPIAGYRSIDVLAQSC
jgi:2-polyprenyl-3-methyl-5-hydroxy-6-metoxy-1,4-benzoquinol methylase